MLPPEALNAFKSIYLAQYGVELSDAEATELAISLLTMVDHVYRPVKQAWLDELPNYPKPKQYPQIKQSHGYEI